jgi:hypothetical protein
VLSRLSLLTGICCKGRRTPVVCACTARGMNRAAMCGEVRLRTKMQRQQHRFISAGRFSRSTAPAFADTGAVAFNPSAVAAFSRTITIFATMAAGDPPEVAVNRRTSAAGCATVAADRWTFASNRRPPDGNRPAPATNPPPAAGAPQQPAFQIFASPRPGRSDLAHSAEAAIAAAKAGPVATGPHPAPFLPTIRTPQPATPRKESYRRET